LKLKRSRLAGLTTAAVIATMATGMTANASADSLTGAGSTLVAPLMAQWSSDFQSKTGNSVTYGAVGSGAGITQITNRVVDFGASDAPLTPDQAAACNGCVQIPWGLTATVLAYHLDGVPKLKLSGKVVAQIYLGAITSWNDPAIKKLNPGVSLPSTAITPVHRSDGSGDTYAFTDWLVRVSKGFKQNVGRSTSVSWPAGPGASKNDGVTAAVNTTNGAIGYVSASYAIAHGLTVAALQNEAGKFEYPNLKNIIAAAAVIKKVKSNNEIHIVDPPKKAKKAYPLSTFTYAIVPKSSPKKSLLQQFINYAITDGQKFGPALDFAPIPKVVLKKSKKSTAHF
jgi:phosphate transport system substrate-binding protein